ncbi:hypothetical protein [Ornithinibacillus bavariensis]|uniref:Uncharacterized protein n=1 Tax=Ornithinibacillus bavariensis TaxID=545502 RepID=A0A919X574_9BACI|nr:hypothetical protein [Ornithinibacillus bavariensis]GIO25741.1 hypothetical protein J43TS3_03520 [Ornithinibacillus bavariensis]HAM79854.1 hypothetical protein [Ornithinibacillus sp.]
MAQEKNMYDECKTHIHAYVLAQLQDGTRFDGIITGLDEDYVYFAIPLENEMSDQITSHVQEQRQYGYGWHGYGGFGTPGFGYPAYGGFGAPGFGYPAYGGFYGPRRRFRRLVLPLSGLTGISLLPWY